MWSLHKLCGILIGLHIFTKAKAFHHGNFPEACETMSPRHPQPAGGFYSPQDSLPPFQVKYTRGNPITVHLSSISPKQFIGFMLEARESEDGPPVGKFILLDYELSRLLTCNGSSDSAVSHRNNRLKTEVKVNWTGLQEERGITFRATFVEYFSTFWENVSVTIPPPTPKPSTTTSTAEPTTATSTTEPNTSTHTTSTTSVAPEPSTTATAAEPSTTTSDAEPNTTANDKEPSTTARLMELRAAAVSLMADSSGLDALSQLASLPSLSLSARSYSSPLVLQICRVLSLVTEIIALILLCVSDSSKVTIIALVCVTIFLNLKQLIIIFLPLGPSHELKEICDGSLRVCSVIHEIFTIAVIFVGVLEIEGWPTIKEESWPWKVTAGYTAWISLFFIWIFIISNYRESKRRGCSKTVGAWNQQNKKMQLGAFDVISIAVSVFFFIGIISFVVAITVGIFV